MRKLLVIICHSHARVRRFGVWIPYLELLKMLFLITEAFELVYEQEPCDKCKEEGDTKT